MVQSIVRLAAEGEEHSPLLPVWIEIVLALVVFGLLLGLLLITVVLGKGRPHS